MFFMQEKFFTSKEAAQITGCTLRQIQYWREKGIVVPVIGDTEDAVFITPGLI
jgi:phage terminase Nu1 subunit (DNA packaging protein)